MRNIGYFCIVKRFTNFLKHITLFLFVLLTHGNTSAQTDSTMLANMDSVHISLLTCAPKQNVYSLYGHTAIRVTDDRRGIDYAVNYGMFSFAKPFFVLRFVFGLTDYEMGITDFNRFKAEYASQKRGVRQQTLNLTRAEKFAIMDAIDNNYRPENRVYRYNYFYDNCTTRARDIILNNVEDKVSFAESKNTDSYRKLIHAFNEDEPWARFGNDLLLGIKADIPTDTRQQQFLPYNLCNDFELATVERASGKKERFVTNSFWVIDPTPQEVEQEFPFTPFECSLILAAIIIAFTLVDLRRKRISWPLDLVLLLADGLAGLILFAMVFSQHPTVSLNLQILLLNPLNIIFIYPTIRALRQGKPCRWLTIWPFFIVLSLIGGLFQSYAEGMYVLALSLLIRYLFIFKLVGKRR